MPSSLSTGTGTEYIAITTLSVANQVVWPLNVRRLIISPYSSLSYRAYGYVMCVQLMHYAFDEWRVGERPYLVHL